MPPSSAPWRTPFLTHLSHLTGPPIFTLATLHPLLAQATTVYTTETASSPSLQALPRARTCVYRGLWATLPPNPHDPSAPRNPPIYESDCPVFTTDARMEKVQGLFFTGANTDPNIREAEREGGLRGSGGGGPVEAVFWIEPARTQWRIRGTAWILAAGDIDDGESVGARKVREMLLSRMRRISGDDNNKEEWSFSREINAHFTNLSTIMRGSFKNPPPGVPVEGNPPGPGEGLGQRVEGGLEEDEMARRNFRVVVIVPEEVDRVDLGDPERARRWLYILRGEGEETKLPGGVKEGDWEVVELWP